MTRRRRSAQQIASAFAIWSFVSLAGAPARAEPPAGDAAAAAPSKREPSAGDLATARAALREGLVLREKGDVATALARLGSAYDLVPTPVTGFELGKTHLMLGHVLQAHELFKKVVRMPASMEESARSQTARDEAARLAKEVEPRIPSLRLKLKLPPGATAVVRIDDDVLPATTIGAQSAETVRAVDPGPHDVVARSGDGPEQKIHVEVAEAETKDVALAPEWVPPRAPAAGQGGQIVYVRQTNPLAFIGFGVAAGALIVTGVATYIYLDARSQQADLCGARYCPPATGTGNGALPEGAVADDAFQGQTTRANASGLTAIFGGIGVVAFLTMGIIGVSRPIKEKVVSSVRPAFGPGHSGLVGTF